MNFSLPTDPATYWDVIIAVMVALFGLLNVLINVLLTPMLTALREQLKFEREKLYDSTVELVNYVSKTTYENTCDLMEYRKKCMQIHMLFKHGEAPEPISAYMNDIFQLFYYREKGTINWEHKEREITRNIIRKIRNELSAYIKKGLKKRITYIVSQFFNTKSIKVNITWNSLTNILIAELNSQPYIYYVKRIDNTLVISYYRRQKSHIEIENLINQLKVDYNS